MIAVASIPISAGREPVYDVVLYPVNAVALGLCGALIVTHRRSYPIGWLLCAMGLDAAFVELTEGYGYHAAWPAAATSEWLTNWTNYLGISGTAILVLLFPSGRHLSRLRRLGVWVASVATVLQMLGAAFGHAADPAFASGVNPYAIDVFDPVYVVGQVVFLGCLLAAIGSVVVRFRRSTGVEHEQLKWVAYALSLLAVAGSAATFLYNDSALVRVAIALVVPLLPVAICVAILRYRLYDIDLIVARTLVYGVLTVLLGAAYAGTVLVLGAALGRGSSWAAAGATLAVALAFRPLRGRVQDVVEQLGVAISELRALANGIRPAYLDDGLDVALRELAGRTPLRVEVHAGRDRYPSDVEATAYFVACEALANTVKHARATGVALRAERKDDHLVLTIHDDGSGGARPAEGTGLRGLADRISAQGGRMRVDSAPDRGTTVIAELPCAS
ncbi:sensor histidine kinase [Cryptosporangium japonicum]|uniref:histidine kinase n=1 Tax=Cryptosporangium japonicum TaxID=80872 RepID=A0ABN0U6H9_9ACTN